MISQVQIQKAKNDKLPQKEWRRVSQVISGLMPTQANANAMK